MGCNVINPMFCTAPPPLPLLQVTPHLGPYCLVLLIIFLLLFFQAYKHIQNSVMTYPGSLTRPEWWRDVVFWDSYVPSKL